MAISYPDVNNRAYSYSSVEIDINGDIFTAVKSINYSDGMEPGELDGTAQHMLGRTAGKYKAECNFDMSLAEFELMKNKLGDGFMLKSFDIKVQYAENEDEQLVTDEIIGFRIKKADKSNASGPDPTMVKVEGHVIYIIHNGKIGFALKRPVVG